jgi:hypothetical protein
MAGAVDGWNKEPLQQILPATLEINQTSGVPSGEPVRIQPDGMQLFTEP